MSNALPLPYTIPDPDVQGNFDKLAITVGGSPLATAAALATGLAAVTKFKMGSFTSHGTTGLKAVTGTGFTPKCVVFFWVTGTAFSAGDNYASSGFGAMTGTTQGAILTAFGDSGGGYTKAFGSATDRCIYAALFNNTAAYNAAYSSFDADGFTINVSAANNSYTVQWLAMG